MKFHFENIGLLDDVDFELADLTVICGENNTGKTYATYAIYGLLRSWRPLLSSVLVDEIERSTQPQDKYQLNLQEMFGGKVNNYLKRLGEHYQRYLPEVFAAKHGAFDESRIHLSVDERPEFIGKAFQNRIQDGPAGKVLATLTKEKEKHILEVLIADDKFLQTSFGGLSEFIADAIADLVFSPYFPRPHISSAERTGVSIFKSELDMARTRVLKALNEMDSKDIKRAPWKLFQQIDATNYAWPVEDNVEFIRQLEEIDKQTSELAKHHPDVLSTFDSIIGGTYRVVRNQGLVFQTTKGGQRRFTMNESSSCVRALLDVGFYLRCKAKPGDLFIIDEPELNLHPKNQRALARLVSRLVNAGIKVLLTTHSDYLIKEFNTLIMLHQRTEHTWKMQQKYGYENEELLDSQRVRLYMTGTKRSTKENSKRSIRINTLIPAAIYPDRGIAATTFDDTIETMNDIQSDILYGGEL
jgi:predicted ATP-dependent endonuclease of OLD family